MSTDFKTIVENKETKHEEKTIQLVEWIHANETEINNIITYGFTTKPLTRAVCIEAIGIVVKEKQHLANTPLLAFVTKGLTDKQSRVKIESSKVIAIIAKQFPYQLEEAIGHLLKNAKNIENDIRTSAAYTLSQIIRLNTSFNQQIIPKVEKLLATEERNGIKKIYSDAIKKVSNL